MARDNEKLSWLDLVLYFGWQVVIEKQLVDEIPHHVRRRTKRFESFFQHLRTLAYKLVLGREPAAS